MSDEHIGIRIKQCMLQNNIGSVPVLSSKTGIPKSYLYQLVNGDIEYPHKYFDLLVKTFDVNPVWLKNGQGSPYTSPKPVSKSKPERHTVLVIREGQKPIESRAEITGCHNILNHYHTALHTGDAQLYYIPEITTSFSAQTLLLVINGLKPGPGLYLASISINSQETISIVNKIDHGDHITFEKAENADHQLIGKIELFISTHASNIDVTII